MLSSVEEGDNMPSETFSNLTKEKKERLINASIEEFSNNLYNNASINRIIKNARIPRGSFYMYFKDKEDLYFYLLNIYKEEHLGRLRRFLEENEKDPLKGFKELFLFIVNNLLEEENSLFFEKMILNMDYLMENKILDRNHHNGPPNKDELLEHIDIAKFNIKDEDDLLSMMHILMILTIHSLVDIIRFKKKKKKITQCYLKELELLGRGFYKEAK